MAMQAGAAQLIQGALLSPDLLEPWQQRRPGEHEACWQAAVEETIEAWETLTRAAEGDEAAAAQLSKQAHSMEQSLVTLRQASPPEMGGLSGCRSPAEQAGLQPWQELPIKLGLSAPAPLQGHTV